MSPSDAMPESFSSFVSCVCEDVVVWVISSGLVLIPGGSGEVEGGVRRGVWMVEEEAEDEEDDDDDDDALPCVPHPDHKPLPGSASGCC